MKIRNGFVSNSSTSSFCLMGIELTEDQVNDIINDFETDIELDEEYDNTHEILYDYIEKNEYGNISYRYDYDLRAYWVGLDINSMQNDETLIGFKKRADTVIKKVFPTLNPDSQWIVEHICS